MLYGKKTAWEIKKRLEREIKKSPRKPGLAVILVGRDPGSLIYVGLKKQMAEQLGIKFGLFRFPSSVSQKKVIITIKKINQNKNFHGLIVQMPLPKKFDPDRLVESISPKKDVDGFSPETKFISPVYQGIMKLIQQSKKPLKNKKSVVLGKSPIFIRSLQVMLKKKGSFTKTMDLKNFKIEKTKRADFLVVALGKTHFLKPEMVKKNAVIIDVGYNRLKGKPAGDVDPRVHAKTSYLSPVPGGLGPLTVIYLFKNVYLAAK